MGWVCGRQVSFGEYNNLGVWLRSGRETILCLCVEKKVIISAFSTP